MDDHLADLMRALESVKAREAEHPVDRPADYVDLPGGGRSAADLLGPPPAEKPKPRSIWDTPASAPKPVAAPKPELGFDLPQKSSGSREPERKVSLGDVAKARKDYEREPFERAREAREKREQQQKAEKQPDPADPTAKGA